MFIQLQFQHLTIWELKLELLAIEHRVVLVDDAMVIWTDDNDVRRVIILRTSEVINMVSFHNAVSILLANSLATNLVAIVVEFLKHADDAAVYLAVLYQ